MQLKLKVKMYFAKLKENAMYSGTTRPGKVIQICNDYFDGKDKINGDEIYKQTIIDCETNSLISYNKIEYVFSREYAKKHCPEVLI